MRGPGDGSDVSESWRITSFEAAVARTSVLARDGGLASE